MSDCPIVDAHQHFWDLERNHLPWLCDEPMIPFRYGDYSAIRRDYLPADYLRVDFCATTLSVAEAFDHEHRRALTHHEAASS